MWSANLRSSRSTAKPVPTLQLLQWQSMSCKRSSWKRKQQHCVPKRAIRARVKLSTWPKPLDDEFSGSTLAAFRAVAEALAG